MERKLASIQRITKLEKIPGADNIEKATILGWELVVKKGEFKENNLCVYIEVDSILPDKPVFEFLRERKFRIRTIKLRKQVSQGICFPLDILMCTSNLKEGDDVTDAIGVKKYDPQAEAERKLMEERAGIHKNRMDKFLKRYTWYRRLVLRPNRLPFPSFIKKTDEDRIQLFPHICEREKDTFFEVTEKIDGQSATYFCIKNPQKWQFWKPYLFGVCSRNFQLLKEDNSSYWTIAKQYDIENKLIRFCREYSFEIAIQGEIIGEGIQGNKYHIRGYDFYVFNIMNIQRGRKTNYYAMNSFCEVNLKLKTVPIINGAFRLKPTIPEIVEFSKGNSQLNGTIREGIVVRNYEKNISFKVINPEFLLKYDC